MNDHTPEAIPQDPLSATLPQQLKRCLSIDLEVSLNNSTIRALAAHRPDTGDSLHFDRHPTINDWTKLEQLADSADFLVGHNLIAFDGPHLRAANPTFTGLYLPQLDTLMLNPLAYPRNPYHHLVKHYRDSALIRTRRNDPLLDSKLTIQALANQTRELTTENPVLLTALHHLTSSYEGAAFDHLFTHIRKAPAPPKADADSAISALLHETSCPTAAKAAIADPSTPPWPLAYILAWIPAAGTNSVISPWVFHQYPETAKLLKRLRDTPCQTPDCPWCSVRHNARAQLTKWFGFDSFRPQPADENGTPLQENITAHAMADQNQLAILPTGTGKSVCYQIPALAKYDATGGLTIVISPLQALMLDQTASLEAAGVLNAAALNGMLSPIQRSDVIDRVRRGDVAILYISPEQLRSPVLENTLQHRQIATWVVDEAHCLSKWGHDFRPDYRYIGRFIRRHHSSHDIPPIHCLTATAKPDVKAEITEYFEETLDVTLTVTDGGAARPNLEFSVIPTTPATKLPVLLQTINAHVPQDAPGGVIVYCATRSAAEKTAEYLNAANRTALHYHAGLEPDTRRDTQAAFADGRAQIIVATNAFGMGIDKPDVRLVVHQDIPGSLENYLQEAGRAGRDNDNAHCVLLYDPEDPEQQHSLSAANRLSRQDIQAVLKALRSLNQKNNRHGPDQPVIATHGEILREDHNLEFQRIDGDERTRVQTAVSWLEESHALDRVHNETTIFPSSVQVPSLSAAEPLLRRTPEPDRTHMRTILQTVLNAHETEGVSTDELINRTGLNINPLRKILADMSQVGVLQDDQKITAFLRIGTTSQSTERLAQAGRLEDDLIKHIQEQAPDQERNTASTLHLRHTTQHFKDNGHPDLIPLTLQRTLRSLDTPNPDAPTPSRNLRIRTTKHETAQITLLSDWQTVQASAEKRRSGAKTLLAHLTSTIPKAVAGADIPASTTMANIHDALRKDIFHAATSDLSQPVQDALMWLHDQEIIRLHSGLSIMRQAMTIRLANTGQQFTQADYQPLQLHYEDQTIQIHIIAQYAETALKSVADSLHLVSDYFAMPKDQFLAKWLARHKADLTRQTTPQSWSTIVSDLHNRQQEQLVSQTNTTRNNLVLAGPGSGKTTMLVHRIAYLIRVQRENPTSIIALAYNRHAAIQIKSRLRRLIGREANAVTVLTCHGMAMRIAGTTFSNHADAADREAQDTFDQILITAAELLEGKNTTSMDPDDQRDRLLEGYRWILVDEYQDLREHEYRLISALAGRTLNDPDAKLTLLAVGDDDQNIYSYRGADNKFIRDFEKDYSARTAYLTQNYRSTRHIIEASNSLIARAPDRLKTKHPITIDTDRRTQPPGGTWSTLDPVTQGQVQILPAGQNPEEQAVLAIEELKRMAALDPNWDWSKTAVITRHWETVQPVRVAATHELIPTQLAREDFTATWHLRETQHLVTQATTTNLTSAALLKAHLYQMRSNTWTDLLKTALDHFEEETENENLPAAFFTDWLAEWIRTNHDTQSGMMLTTAHSAKGLEYDHVVILDNNWNPRRDRLEAERRLFYVAMTRAKKSLTICQIQGSRHAFLPAHASTLLRAAPASTPPLPPGIHDRLQRASLKDAFLGFAGRRKPDHQMHQDIANLQPGDPLQIQRTPFGTYNLLGPHRRPVGRTSKSFKPLSDTAPEARVLGIARWNKTKSGPEYASELNCDSWEVVIPEFIFPPA